MTKTFSLSAYLVAVIAAAIMFVPAILLTSSTKAQEDGEQQEQTEQQEQAPEGSYSFTAQSGDSYTKMARKAVQIFGIENEVGLTGEQIVFAETNLTLQAGSPALNVGQEVSIEKSTVKEWVDKAQELSDAQKRAWAVYTSGVDFNTDDVGE